MRVGNSQIRGGVTALEQVVVTIVYSSRFNRAVTSLALEIAARKGWGRVTPTAQKLGLRHTQPFK